MDPQEKSATKILAVPETVYSKFVFENVAKHAETVAAIEASTGKSIRYSELVESIRKLSSALWKLGLRTPDIVSVNLGNCIDIILLQQAIVTTGAAATFSKPTWSDEEFVNHYKNIQPKVVFTMAVFAEKVASALKAAHSTAEIFLVGQGDDSSKTHGKPYEALLEDDGAESRLFDESIVKEPKKHVVFISHTSGSTGLPKGVMWSHYGMTYKVAAACDAPGEDQQFESGVLGLQGPLFHATGLFFSGFSMRQGFTLVLLEPFDIDAIITAASQYKVTTLAMIPQMVSLLAGRRDQFDKFDLSPLNFILYGGTYLPEETEKALMDRLRQINPDVDINQIYGQTEAGGVISRTPPKKFHLPGKYRSVGRLIFGVELKIIAVGATTPEHEVATKEHGEIWVRSPSIMLGYLNNPTASSKVLMKDGWLKTGDYAYRDEDGYYFLVDRIQHLIQRKGGKSVSPSEIERVIDSHPLVQETAVLGVATEKKAEEDDGDNELFACVVRKNDGEQLTEEEVVKFVAERLLDPLKHVKGVRFVRELPHNPYGKIRRQNLRELLLS